MKEKDGECLNWPIDGAMNPSVSAALVSEVIEVVLLCFGTYLGEVGMLVMSGTCVVCILKYRSHIKSNRGLFIPSQMCVLVLESDTRSSCLMSVNQIALKLNGHPLGPLRGISGLVLVFLYVV